MHGQAFAPALPHAPPAYLPPAASAPHAAHAQRRSVDMGALARTGQAAYGACGAPYGGAGALSGGAGFGGLEPAARHLLGAPSCSWAAHRSDNSSCLQISRQWAYTKASAGCSALKCMLRSCTCSGAMYGWLQSVSHALLHTCITQLA